MRGSVPGRCLGVGQLLRAAHQAHGFVDQLAGKHWIGLADRDGQAIAGFGFQTERAGRQGDIVGRFHIAANSRNANRFHASAQEDSADPDSFEDEGEAFGDADFHVVVVPTDEDGLRRKFADAHGAIPASSTRHRWTGHLWQGRFGAVDYGDTCNNPFTLRRVGLS